MSDLPSILFTQMETNQNLANIQMVCEVSQILRRWWGNIRVAHEEEVMAHLGSFTNLMELRENKLFIQLMVEFWDPTLVTFGFLNLEITPTLEEISQIASLR